MLWLPRPRLEVAQAVVALLIVTGWATHEPIVVEPFLKFTVPLGLAPVMVAVSVTDWPALDGFCDELRLVVLGWSGPAVIVTEGWSVVSIVTVAPAGP
jgi:hypothetical protein